MAGSCGLTYIPCWRPVEALGYIMVALAVSAQVQDFVLDVFGAVAVDTLDVVSEALPSRQILAFQLIVSGICAVYEPEVCFRLRLL